MVVLIAVIVAAGLVADARWWQVLGAAAAYRHPVMSALVVGALTWMGRRSQERSSSEGVFLQAMAAELRAGSGLRAAIEASAAAVPDLPLAKAVRLASAGVPLDDVAAVLPHALPDYGAMAGVALTVADRTGGRVASVFGRLAAVAAEDRELRREARAATAQARLSAVIVGGLPAPFLAWGLAAGWLPALARSGAGRPILAAGLVLLVAGVLAVHLMVRRALT